MPVRRYRETVAASDCRRQSEPEPRRSPILLVGVECLIPPNFSAIIPGKLGGMAWPGSGRLLKERLQWLKAQGFHAVCSVCEMGLDPEGLRQLALEYRFEEIPDFGAPPIDILQDLVQWIHDRVLQDKGVVVHCGAGYGRTGTVLAAYLIYAHNLSAHHAIAQTRELRAGSIESVDQEIILYRFAYELGRPKSPLPNDLARRYPTEYLERNYGLPPDSYER